MEDFCRECSIYTNRVISMAWLDYLFRSKTMQTLDSYAAEQVKKIPPSVIVFLLILFLFSLIALLWLWSWKRWLSPDAKLIRQYKEEKDVLNQDSKQKSLIITLTDQINREIARLMDIENKDECEKHALKVFDMVVEQIPVCLKRARSINHRCAIFVPDHQQPEYLKILEGSGFSVDGKEKLRLDMDTLAGLAYRTGEVQYSPDVTKDERFKPHPKARRKYHSLLCVPIKSGKHVFGVLSVDGSDIDCFTEDDKQYVQLFATQIAIIFPLAQINK